MTDLYFCQHAETRAAQRGFLSGDVEFIAKHGVEVERGFMLTEKLGRAHIDDLRRQIVQIERLIGKRVVCDGSTIVTAYHPGRRKSRSVLQHTPQRDWR